MKGRSMSGKKVQHMTGERKIIPAFMRLLYRVTLINNDDVEWYVKKEKPIPREISKDAKQNSKSILKIDSFILDIANVDDLNIRRIVPFVAALKVLMQHRETLLDGSGNINHTFRLNLPSLCVERCKEKQAEIIEIVNSGSPKQALDRASDLIKDMIQEEIDAMGDKFFQDTCGQTDTEKLFEEDFKFIQQEQETALRSEKLTASVHLDDKFNKEFYCEHFDVKSDIDDVLDRDDIIDMDEESFYCKFCGDEIMFVTNSTAYCETCDITFSTTEENDLSCVVQDFSNMEDANE